MKDFKWNGLQCNHTRWKLEAGNKVDPDDGNSMVCNACRLPIFSTPFVTTTTTTTTTTDDRCNNLVIMHDQCADDHYLPQRLKGHPLHPTYDLVLRQEDSTTTSINNNNNNNERYCCSRCNSMCGSKFYACFGDDKCGFGLDLACALKIRIQHRSHGHRLEASKGTSFSFICAACGTQHNRAAGFKKGYSSEGLTTWDLSYACSACDFWIHPDCALLPNAIILDKHQHHPLLLTYLGQVPFWGFWQNMPTDISCSICDDESEGFGYYACFCCDYYAHIKCVVYSDPGHCSFKPVLLRDAQVPNLIGLPLSNEHTSVVSHILSDQTTTVASNYGDHYGQTRADGSKLILFKDERVHEHPLILHEQHLQQPLLTTTTHDDDDVARVCSACVQLISLTDGPFYSCDNNNNNELAAAGSPCIDFFLHRCCAHLPATFTIPDDRETIDLTLVDKSTKPFNLFECPSCERRCNGSAYRVEGSFNTDLDVVCALMSSAIITHDAHAKSHILQPISRVLMSSETHNCRCCREDIRLYSAYGCTNCHNFNIHAKCALLPNTVKHKFDRHSLKLITTTTSTTLITLDDQEEEEEEEESVFCEICEKDLDRKLWYYYCDKCDQSFHVRCIPCLDELSKIKFGFAVRVKGHDCPLTCVRAFTVAGYSCRQCEQTIDEEFEDIAFECSECYFRIHEKCAKKLFLPNS